MSSIATTRSAFATTSRALRAAIGPMLTWSSWFAEVGIESTEAGCASGLFSLTSAAAVTCAIIRPLQRPGSRARKGGRPERSGLTRFSTRRSEIDPSSAAAIAM